MAGKCVFAAGRGAVRLARTGRARVGSNGVVSVTIARTGRFIPGGRPVGALLGLSTAVEFLPLPGGRAPAVADFALTGEEVMPVVRVMRAHGWRAHRLYNQETRERPQLYFCRMLKAGAPLALARGIRAGLGLTRAQSAG